MAFISGAGLVTKSSAAPAKCCAVRMSAESEDGAVSRRQLLAGSVAAALAAVAAVPAALADREYENVGFLGGGDQVDVNNANVRAYIQFPGMYPNIAGVICKNGPYDSVADLYKLDLNDKQKEVLKKYESKLVALPPRPEYMIDRFNNGLYR
eukprot:CAMPEP_0182449818 /NCGR_PEP_ID=MMETSP1172-20130603/36904_1 /TAXON_ID=708627 /ORGANISM="Timspurckia oligopyrenoides, Strain CCMP3278" /LENGTH=151 /DNA_ID=CAMNT_0024647203 /DNA_START=62 /DNA_END=517 /DNA_ORIENTATION=-